MLQQNISQRIRNIVQTRQETYTNALHAACQQAMQDTAIQAIRNPSSLAARAKQLCDQLVMQRAGFIWETIQRVANTMRITWYPTLADDLKAELRTLLNQEAGEANRVFHERITIPEAAQIVILDVPAISLYNPEIDLLCDGLRADAIAYGTKDEIPKNQDEKFQNTKTDIPNNIDVKDEQLTDSILRVTPYATSDACEKIEEDTLGRRPYVEAIADFVSNSRLEGPFTIAVTGGWGSGKSVFLDWVSQALRAHGYKTVWFNAWKYETKHTVWASLALAILEQHGSAMVHLNIWRKRLCKTINLWWVAAFLSLSVILGIVVFFGVPPLNWKVLFPGLGIALTAYKAFWPFFSSPLVEKLRDVKGIDYEKELGFQYRFEEEFESLVKELATMDKPLIIFVDDLDRLSPNKISEVFEAIHFLGANRNCVFFVGLDYKMVSRRLSERYQQSTEEFGFHFVDKFMQIVFALPEPTKAQLEQYVGSLIHKQDKSSDLEKDAHIRREEKSVPHKEDSKPEANVTEEIFENSKNIDHIASQAIEWLPKNPRAIKRFVNNFRLTAFIAIRLGLLGRNQANLLPLAGLLAARQSYPALMDLLNHKDAKLILPILNGYLETGSVRAEHEMAAGHHNFSRFTHDANKLRQLIPVLYSATDRYREVLNLVH
jgi:Cdc6-like AAA superfamily ATPase